MIVFWIVGALFLAGALLMLLPPLLRPRSVAVGTGEVNVAVHRDHLREAGRDLAQGLISPERYEQTRAEIERRVIEDLGDEQPGTAAASVRMALALALLVPLASVALYLLLGEPRASEPSTMALDRHATQPQQVQRMVTALAERLKNEPNNAEGWLMLGRSYTSLGRYRDGAMALRRASELMPGNANVLADLADVTGMAQGKRLAGEPARYIQQALDIDPRHGKALSLAGTVAFENKDYAAARGYWERLVAVLPPGSPMLRSVQGSLAEAARLDGGAHVATTADAPAASSGPAILRGEVQISADLAARVQPGDTLFIFARAAEGPRMPLAILRRPVSGWPHSFWLDDSMAMSPQQRLSSSPQVVVGARISRSGNATPQSGDLVGYSGAVTPTAQGVKVLIEQVNP